MSDDARRKLEQSARWARAHSALVELAQSNTPSGAEKAARRDRWADREIRAVYALAKLRSDFGVEAFESFVTQSPETARPELSGTEHPRERRDAMRREILEDAVVRNALRHTNRPAEQIATLLRHRPRGEAFTHFLELLKTARIGVTTERPDRALAPFGSKGKIVLFIRMPNSTGKEGELYFTFDSVVETCRLRGERKHGRESLALMLVLASLDENADDSAREYFARKYFLELARVEIGRDDPTRKRLERNWTESFFKRQAAPEDIFAEALPKPVIRDVEARTRAMSEWGTLDPVVDYLLSLGATMTEVQALFLEWLNGPGSSHWAYLSLPLVTASCFANVAPDFFEAKAPKLGDAVWQGLLDGEIGRELFKKFLASRLFDRSTPTESFHLFSGRRRTGREGKISESLIELLSRGEAGTVHSISLHFGNLAALPVRELDHSLDIGDTRREEHCADVLKCLAQRAGLKALEEGRFEIALIIAMRWETSFEPTDFDHIYGLRDTAKILGRKVELNWKDPTKP